MVIIRILIPSAQGFQTTTNLGGHEITNIVSYNWQGGSLGNYYLPTNSPVIDKGNTNANLLGLYQFTTQTNQMKETNSIVDMGYHYVSTDANGNPLDSNGDGIPDYLEDANGDGLVDNGETNWALAIITQPTNQTVLVGSYVYFSVGAGGVQPVSYQWQFEGTNISGEVYPVLVLAVGQTNQSGTYTVVVTNAFRLHQPAARGASTRSAPPHWSQPYPTKLYMQDQAHKPFL